jgi:hypothetical protein
MSGIGRPIRRQAANLRPLRVTKCLPQSGHPASATLRLGARNDASVRQTEAGSPDHRRRELVLLQGAFYSGARGVLMVLDHLAEQGDVDELHRIIGRFGTQIRATRRRPRSQH